MSRIACAAAIIAASVSSVGRAADAREETSRYFPTLDAAASGHADTGTPVKATIYWENDGGWVKPVDRRDEHFTHGAGLSISARPAWAREIGRTIWSVGDEFCPTCHPKETSFAVGVVLAQEIYTPENYLLTRPQPDDRPYAGYLKAGFYFQRARMNTGMPWDASLEHIQFDFGIIGPSSLAENAQKGVHRGLGYDIPQGWGNQLHDEPAFDFTYMRKWRFLLVEQGAAWMPAAEAIPEAGLTLGTVHREGTLGNTFRLIWGEVPNDFGPGRLQMPSAFTGDLMQNSFSLFGRSAVHVVEHNTLIEGNNWRSSVVRQDIEPVVGEFQFGVVCQFMGHFEIGYSWTYRTPEFDGQRSWDSNGALNVSLVGSF